MRRLTLVLMLIAFCSIGATAQKGYEITLKIKELKNQDVILGHYFASPKNTLVDDTVHLDAAGVGTLKGNKALVGGMYFLYYPGKLLDIIIGDEQHFTIESDTVDFVAHAKITNSTENQLLFDYQKVRTQQAGQNAELEKQLAAATSEADKEKIRKKMEDLNNVLIASMEDITTKHPNLFFSTFLKATRDLDVPDKFKDNKGKFIDSMYFDYMKYYEQHYFDNFDLTNERLLNTPIYDNKLSKYLDLIERQNPIDSILIIVDRLLANSRKSPEMFRYMLITLHNKYAQSQIMGMDRVFVHVAEKYYIPEATWSTPDYIEKLKQDVRRKKHTLIGDVAKELKMTALPHDDAQIAALREKLKVTKEKGMVKKKAYDERKKAGTATADDSLKLNNDYYYIFKEFDQNIEEYVSLHQMENRYTVVWFWEPSCSHCRKATPILADVYGKINKSIDVGVYAVFIQAFIVDWPKYTQHIDEWLEFVVEHHLTDFANTWDVQHSTQFRDFYDISGTPVAYLLDNEKKIIAKRMGIEQLEDILFERTMFDIREGNDKKMYKAKVKAMITPAFTLREIAAMRYGVRRIFDRATGEDIEKVLDEAEATIKARFDKKINELITTGESKDTLKRLKDYADTLLNADDLNYVKVSAGSKATESVKTELDKHIDNRIKYNLEG